MYERSAIVLERYFENLFGINKPSNVVQNYKNYCELFEKFNNFQRANSEEFTALEEFQNAENTIEDIQAQEEKLYKKNAKYEYNRDLVFNDISQKPDEIEKCMLKIEGDIEKTQNSLITLREKFVESVRNYNEKKSALAKCKKNRKNAEVEYNAIFEVTKQNMDNIPEEYIALAKSFSEEDGQEELIERMLDNGKDEKIPFNNAVVRNAVKVAFDIQKRFIEAYVDVYNKTNKLVNELLEGAVSVELHEKTIRNNKVKFNFLNAEKDYLIQFLDYERIMVIHGKRMHRNLMLEACENFNTDIAQIDNLYTLLVKEITNKSTKKAYKDLYNKSYLIDIEENDEKFKKEKNKINLSTATIMNTNYWRIEGIKNIYTVFYKDVVEVFGKVVDEFEVPKDPDELENENEESLFESVQEVEAKAAKTEEVEKPEEKVKKVVIEQVSEDAPALPGMAEAIAESEMEISKKAEMKAKSLKEKAEKEAKAAKVEEVENTEKTAKAAKAEEVEKPEKVSKKEKPVSIEDLFDEIEEPEEDVAEVEDDFEDDFEETDDFEDDFGETQDDFGENVAAAKVEEPDYNDIFDEIITEPEPLTKKKTAKKVKRYTRKKEKVSAIVNEQNEPQDIFGGIDDKFSEKNVATINVEEPDYSDVFDEIETEPDIFGDKYKDIEKQIAELDDLDNIDDMVNAKVAEFKKMTKFEKASVEDEIKGLEEISEDMPYEDEDTPYEEETIFDNIDNEDYEDLKLKKIENKSSKKATKKATKQTKQKKNGLLKNIMKLNAKDNKKVTAN